MSEQSRKSLTAKVIAHFTATVDGMSSVASDFLFTDCMDLLQVIKENSRDVEVDEDFWTVLLAIF